MAFCFVIDIFQFSHIKKLNKLIVLDLVTLGFLSLTLLLLNFTKESHESTEPIEIVEEVKTEV
ncbi:MAG: hypothetical protein Kow0081_0420 [Candidatus Dojkabacteria bacterium]